MFAPAMERVAADYKGLRLILDRGSGSPYAGLGQASGPDLAFIEWGGAFFSAETQRDLADLAPERRRLVGLASQPAGILAALDLGLGATARSKGAFLILPVAAAPWGLFSSLEALKAAALPSPAYWTSVDASLKAIAGSGIRPIALGGGSPGGLLAWISFLDLRLNGAKAHRALLEGSRGFDDPSLRKVYGLLAAWRDAGYFGEDPLGQTWVECARELAEGRAGIMLLGAGLRDRFPPGNVGFSAFPDLEGGTGDRGELANLWGFVVSAGSDDRKSAVAYADAFARAAGADPDLLAGEGPYRRPLAAAGRAAGAKARDAQAAAAGAAQQGATSAGGPGADTAAFLRAESAILAAGSLVLPTLDRFLAPSIAGAFARTLEEFFAKGSGMGAEELGRKLASFRPRGQ